DALREPDEMTAVAQTAAPVEGEHENYFAKKYASPVTNENAALAQEAPKETNDSGGFMAMVENFNRSIGRVAEGVLHMGATAIGADDYANKVKQVHEANDASAAAAAEKHPYWAGAGSVIGNIGRS